jgi:hypothetical protein
MELALVLPFELVLPLVQVLEQQIVMVELFYYIEEDLLH